MRRAHRSAMQARQERKDRSTCERIKVAEGDLDLDIKGAKALKERLGRHGAEDVVPVPVDVNVPEDARPVYHWTGKTPPEGATSEVAEEDSPRRAALFSRLSLSFR